ncbi:hypothetical protein V6Z93_000003 [Aspergillus fumigatus]
MDHSNVTNAQSENEGFWPSFTPYSCQAELVLDSCFSLPWAIDWSSGLLACEADLLEYEARASGDLFFMLLPEQQQTLISQNTPPAKARKVATDARMTTFHPILAWIPRVDDSSSRPPTREAYIRHAVRVAAKLETIAVLLLMG